MGNEPPQGNPNERTDEGDQKVTIRPSRPQITGPMQVLEARFAFATEVDGVPVSVHLGERVHAGHRIVREHPENFKPVEPSEQFRVEDTSADPGRGRRRR